MAFTRTMKMKDVIINEYTIKTAAPRGALRLFYNYVSVDAMSGIEYDDRGLCGRCSHGIRCILRIAPCCQLHPCRADGENSEEQRASCHNLSDFRFHIYHLWNVLVKVYVRGQGNMTILETGEYQATVPDKNMQRRYRCTGRKRIWHRSIFRC